MSSKIIHGLLLGTLISAVLIVFYAIGLFDTWNTRLSDQLFTQKTPRSDIVIIAIDDKSINEIGRWPWERSTHAKLLNILSRMENKPGSIGIDISFFEPEDSKNDQELANILKKFDNVTLAAEFNKQLLLPIEILKSVSSYGIVNLNQDSDGIVRNTFLSPFGNLSFSQQVIRNYKKDAFKINFVGKPGTFPYFSYVDVLNGNIKPDVFKDKIVLIGATAPNLHDAYLTPVSNGVLMPGVEIHANTIQTILDQKFILTESKTVTILTFIISSLFLSVIFSILGIIPAIILIFISLIGYFIYTIFSFDKEIVRNIIYPPLAIILSGISNIAYKYLSENKQKTFIKKAFSYYLSESVLNEILKNPKMLRLGGERREVTVLFSDIAGFTTISESTPPERLTYLLNTYLTEMTNIVLENKGVLDKYIGDAIMAFWGAPLYQKNHAFLACKTAIEMLQKLKKSEIYKFNIRIGINTGEAIVGNMGSKNRFDYTVLGDTVNIASRLEGLNKESNTSIIISKATFNQVKEYVVAKKLGTFNIKGKTKRMEVYELLKIKT